VPGTRPKPGRPGPPLPRREARVQQRLHGQGREHRRLQGGQPHRRRDRPRDVQEPLSGAYTLEIAPAGEEARCGLFEAVGGGGEASIGVGRQVRPVAIETNKSSLYLYNFHPYLERALFASAPQGLHLFDSTKGGQLAQLPLPVASPVGWSGAEDGTLFLLGARAGKQSLVATDLLGIDRWQWALGPGETFGATQPPILGPEGQVYALSQARVSCVKLGLHLWSFACPAPSYGCSLADNSILVTTGRLLVQLDALGQKKLEVDLEAPAVAPPVVDEAGKVLVATRTHLVRID
jgi:hypothetical protein